MPYCDAVLPTRKAISPRFAIKMDCRGSDDSEVDVDCHRRPLLEMAALVELLKARTLAIEDMITSHRDD